MYRIRKMNKYAVCICVIAVTRTILGLLNTKGFQIKIIRWKDITDLKNALTGLGQNRTADCHSQKSILFAKENSTTANAKVKTLKLQMQTES